MYIMKQIQKKKKKKKLVDTSGERQERDVELRDANYYYLLQYVSLKYILYNTGKCSHIL